MKNMIYQYWQGNLKPGVIYSTELMKKYADKIGAEYRFDHNKNIAGKKVNVPIYYEPANPLVDDSFDEYDNVALIDIDVYPKDNLEKKTEINHLVDDNASKENGLDTEISEKIPQNDNLDSSTEKIPQN